MYDPNDMYLDNFDDQILPDPDTVVYDPSFDDEEQTVEVPLTVNVPQEFPVPDAKPMSWTERLLDAFDADDLFPGRAIL